MKELKQPHFLILYGATGVGKTDFALKIAHQLQGHIINMDVGQFYTPLNIGTAKPDWHSQKVPHHLFDIVDEPRNITATQYRTLVLDLFKELWARGELPILVGGSGFYLKSLLFPPSAHSANSFEVDLQSTSQELWNRLHSIDPLRAAQIHKNDRYRINRALAIWQSTGRKPSEYTSIFAPPSSFTLVHLMRDREDLYKRIDQRTLYMIDAGWIEETQQLTPEWISFLKTKKIIGYEAIADYIQSSKTENSLQTLIGVIQQRTRNYAKRQETFWRGLKKAIGPEFKAAKIGKIISINLTLMDDDLYIKQVFNTLMEFYE
jgi:tRNA dimethylallyltransferase